MTDPHRRELIYEIFGEAYPAYCIGLYSKQKEGTFFVQPRLGESPKGEAEEALAFYENLDTLSDEELELILVKRREAEQLAAEAALSFNQPEALATAETYSYWCKARYWSMSEATALLIGRDPKHISGEKVRKTRIASKIGAHYLQSYQLVSRGFQHIWKTRIIAPSEYVHWALNIGMAIPQDLLDALAVRGFQIDEWTQEQAALKATIAELREQVQRLEQEAAEKSTDLSPKSLSVRERESLLKLVIGMAMDGYGFDPKASRSPTARELSDHLLRLDLQLSDDTIRAYLQEAKDLLPGELPE
ncbi:hypothetical protein IMCC20628_03964 [Hoeflea sp. IMCC20628]|uniref:hypothetical protein n=1 Tax=Hoeflea sp. IMCC20628 TaxID=1620421 RepID=UPI00063B0958|nr:hypothetical protein [Hoeflea sp. IMCC20628]AKI02645.1 hypothetical protein IMCC20628_03964 [Hoeflea sp. IMCC20628]